MNTTKLIQINYKNKKQAQELTYLLNQYSQDPIGGGKALPKEVLENLADELAQLPHAGSVIAYVDEEPAGLVNFFEAFSTFACKPLINIHDIVVLKEFRGQGLSQMMLAKVEEIAKTKGCCKITLEVLSNNEVAKASYTKYGFKGYDLDPKAGHAIFWQKELS